MSAGRISQIIVFAGILATVFSLSCQKENDDYGTHAVLEFSSDTVLFDTVFTTIGSTTRQLQVYNRSDQDVRIGSIRLAGGADSPFRINVDGIPGPEVNDYLLRSKDSMYLFVEVTIDPTGENNPLVVQDSVVFATGNNRQDIDLVAWGQDVHLFNGQILQSQTWTNDKPYLVYNSILLDTGQVLTIGAGVNIHFHRFSTFYVAGTLQVEGTLDEPVVFQGDRLEQVYDDVPGQWYGLYFLNGSSGHRMENVVVKNASSGVHLGNLFTPDPPPDLFLANARIEHMSYTGISSIGGKIRAQNVIVGDCGFYGVLLTAGGDYEFIHCTLANYWTYSNRISPNVLLSNYFAVDEDQVIGGDLVRADFGNCIIDGRRDGEIGLEFLDGAGLANFHFDHCLVKVDASIHLDQPAHFTMPYSGEPPGFSDVYAYCYELTEDAYARDKGDPLIAQGVPLDLLGLSRLEDTAPDLGALEMKPEK